LFAVLVGDRYNNLMEKYKQQAEKYKQQVAKCAEECAPKKKYAAECAERRRLYNELIELRGNIRVFCRCRPLSADEISRGVSSVVEVDPSQETDLQYVPTEKERRSFKFDHVFGPADDQGYLLFLLCLACHNFCFKFLVL
jgi:kinesin family protein C2/C3